MKKRTNYFVILTAQFFVACAGNETATEISNDSNNNEPVDSALVQDDFSTFVNYVDALEPTISNVDSAFAKYDGFEKGFTQEQHDSSFFVIKQFMQKFEIAEDEIDYSEDGFGKLEKKYSKAGFWLWSEEGYYYPMPDNKFLYKKFKKNISAELGDFINLLIEIDYQITADAGLIIPYEDLANQVIICEDYLVKNADSKYFDEAMVLYHDRLNFLMWGLDNTPVINNWNEDEILKLEAEVETAYNNVINDKKHKSGLIIKDHWDYLISVNYEFEQADWITEKEIKMYLGIE